MENTQRINDYIKALMQQPSGTKVLAISVDFRALSTFLSGPYLKGKTGTITVPMNWTEAGRWTRRLPDFLKLNELRVFSAKTVEDAIFHIVMETKFNDSFVVTKGRYMLDFNGLTSGLLRTIVDKILLSESKRINYSWIEPLQTLLLEKQFSEKKKSNVKASASEEEAFEWKPQKAKAYSAPSGAYISSPSTGQIASGNGYISYSMSPSGAVLASAFDDAAQAVISGQKIAVKKKKTFLEAFNEVGEAMAAPESELNVEEKAEISKIADEIIDEYLDLED